jgi:hypothetical protein
MLAFAVVLAGAIYSLRGTNHLQSPVLPDPGVWKEASTRIPVFVSEESEPLPQLTESKGRISVTSKGFELELKKAFVRITELEDKIRALEFQLKTFHEERAETAVEKLLQMPEFQTLKADDQFAIASFVRRLGRPITLWEFEQTVSAMLTHLPRIDEIKHRLYTITSPAYPGPHDPNDPEFQSLLQERRDLFEAWNKDIERIFGKGKAETLFFHSPSKPTAFTVGNN